MPHCFEWERVGVGLEFRCKYVAPLSASSTGFSQVRVEPVEAFQNLAIQNKDNLELNIYIIHQVHTGKNECHILRLQRGRDEKHQKAMPLHQGIAAL